MGIGAAIISWTKTSASKEKCGGVEGHAETETHGAIGCYEPMTDAPKGWQYPHSRYQARSAQVNTVEMTVWSIMDISTALAEKSEEELLEILAHLRLTEDFPYFSEKILKVQTMKGTIIPFKVNTPQRILHHIIEDLIRPKRLVRLVILKARRFGFSTYFSGRFYQRTSRVKNRYAVQVTHEPEATDTLFKMIKRFYNFSPKDERPSTVYNNTRLLEFNTKEGTGLNSAIRVATAGKEDFGSGQTIHYAHLSETAKWDEGNIESLLTSILQCVPDEPDTAVVFESTAKGIGGEYYDRFWGARYRIWIKRLDDSGKPVIETEINSNVSEDNVYTSIFFPWFVFPDYSMPVPLGLVLTPEEEDIKKKYGLSDEQMAWRRWIIANKCNGKVDTFNQEYPACPEHAFLGSGRPVFDNAKLLALKDTLPQPVARYECLLSTYQWLAKEEGRLLVWEEPKAGGAYIISADVSEGLKEGDWSSADVIDHRTGKQVAQWHGKIDPDAFALVLIALGMRYNYAWIAPERNNHGLMVVTVLVNENYPQVYSEMVPEPPGKPRKRFGWVTSNATRPLIIDNLIKEVREDTHGINCLQTIEEMMAFKHQDNGKMEADPNRNDDRVMSYAIGKHLRQILPLPSSWHRNQMAGRLKGKRKKQQAPSTKGWT